jgi:hypothetical protein
MNHNKQFADMKKYIAHYIISLCFYVYSTVHCTADPRTRICFTEFQNIVEFEGNEFKRYIKLETDVLYSLHMHA